MSEDALGHLVRARWLDKRTGTFLSPDPMGYRDSANLYAYCAEDPVNCTDPTGLFGEDFHYYLTLYLAVRSGFSIDEALIIAAEAEGPDQDARSPVKTAIRSLISPTKSERDWQAEKLRTWHFPKKDTYSGEVQPGSMYAARIVNMGVRSGNLREFGSGMHPLQDSWSHRGHPSLHGNSGHPYERSPFGFLSSHTDDPAAYPDESLTAASATYAYMRAFRKKWRTSQSLGPEWDQIGSEIEDYILLQTEEEKDQWLTLNLERLTELPETELYKRIHFYWKTLEPYEERTSPFYTEEVVTGRGWH